MTTVLSWEIEPTIRLPFPIVHGFSVVIRQ